MRTILVPPIQYYDEIIGNYYSLCDSLGFKNKYKKPTEMTLGKEYEKPQYSIHIDTREQLPLKFDDYPTRTTT